METACSSREDCIQQLILTVASVRDNPVPLIQYFNQGARVCFRNLLDKDYPAFVLAQS